MRRLTYILIALLITLPALAIESTGEMSYETSDAIWQELCDFSEANDTGLECETLSSPVVLYTPLRQGLWGKHYTGSSVVWMSDKFRGMPWTVYENGIIMHEMVHYLLDQNDELQAWTDQCKNEDEAWKVYNWYVRKHDRDDMVNEDWSQWYDNCEGREYSPSFSIKDILNLIPGIGSKVLPVVNQ